MESGIQSLNSSEEAVVADPLNMTYLVKEEDIKSDITNINTGVAISNIEIISTITANENMEDDISIKEEIIDEQEHSWPIESVRTDGEMEPSDGYFDNQKMEHPFDKNLQNSHSKLSTHIESKLETSEDLDKRNFSVKREFDSDEVINPHDKPYSSDVYDRIFHYNSDHQRVHADESRYSERKCDLFDCQRSHTDEKPFSCASCNKKFSNKGNLSRHMRIHTGEKPFSCIICNKTFNSKSDMNMHIRIHTGEKPFSCNICNKTFSQNISLINHKRIHTGEKPFSCSICYKTFNNKSAVGKHMIIHTGEQPFSCDICNKTFTQKSNMINHKRFHTGEKPYSCDICNKKFSQKVVLDRHIRFHTGEKPFSCVICNKLFTRKSYLKTHIRIHTRTDRDKLDTQSNNSQPSTVHQQLNKPQNSYNQTISIKTPTQYLNLEAS